jgi:hypothetical protein
MKLYFPYKSDRPNKKYYIVTKDNKKVYFGASGYQDYTMHKDDERKKRYISRHQSREDWSINGINSAGWWSRYLLWNKPTIKQSYDDIKQRFSSIFIK